MPSTITGSAAGDVPEYRTKVPDSAGSDGVDPSAPLLMVTFETDCSRMGELSMVTVLGSSSSELSPQVTQEPDETESESETID